MNRTDVQFRALFNFNFVQRQFILDLSLVATVLVTVDAYAHLQNVSGLSFNKCMEHQMFSILCGRNESLIKLNSYNSEKCETICYFQILKYVKIYV